MNRRDLTRTLIAAAAGLVLSSGVQPATATSPNLLFVFPDQMRMHAMGIWSEPGYNHLLTTVGDPVYTPNLDQLAKDGVLFTQAYSTRPVCSPYRAMLMSGMYSARNGVSVNCKIGRDVGLRHDLPTLTGILADEGYETGYVGKVHWEKNEHLFNSSLTYVGPSGTTTPHAYDTYVPPGPGRHGNTFWFQHLSDSHNNAMSYASKSYLIAGKADGEMHRANRFTPEHEADIVVAFINNTHGERDSSKPFSMFWSPNPPHPPYSGPGDVDPEVYNTHYASKPIAELGLRDNFDSGTAASNIRYYFSNVTSIDQHLGRVLQALEDSGEAANTIVIFTSDHGELLGSHSQKGKNEFYDEAFLIPFVLRYPGQAAPRVEDLMIGPVDLMPTLLSMMGFKDRIPLSVQGCDYAHGILTGDYSQQPKPASAFYRKGTTEAGVRTSQYMYRVASAGATTLYDNVNDPYQMTNRPPSSIPAPDLAFLQKALGQWLRKAEDEWYAQRLFSDKITYPNEGDAFNMEHDGTDVLSDVPKNETVYVESSTNLSEVAWEPVGTNSSPAYASRQAHGMDTTDQSRYYRVRQRSE